MTPGCVIVSGLPASGRTTLAWALADLTGLALIDKDAILEELYRPVDRGRNRPRGRRGDGP